MHSYYLLNIEKDLETNKGGTGLLTYSLSYFKMGFALQQTIWEVH